MSSIKAKVDEVTGAWFRERMGFWNSEGNVELHESDLLDLEARLVAAFTETPILHQGEPNVSPPCTTIYLACGRETFSGKNRWAEPGQKVNCPDCLKKLG